MFVGKNSYEIFDSLKAVTIGCSKYRLYKGWKIAQISWLAWAVYTPTMEYAFATGNLAYALGEIDKATP